MHGRQRSYHSKLPKQLVFDGHMFSECGDGPGNGQGQIFIAQMQQARTAYAEISTTTILMIRNGFANWNGQGKMKF